MVVQRIRSSEWFILSLILLLAAGLRMLWPGWTEFKADEARLMILAWDMATGQMFPLRGLSSSVGIPNFPVSAWIYAIPLAVWRHPYAPTLFTGLLNTITVGGCYWFVRRYWGWQAAVFATLMFAISPWAVVHSRKIWAQNLLPIFAMGWGISAAFAYVERRPRWLAVHIACAAVAFQIHLAAVSLVVGSAMLIVMFWKRVAWRWLFVGVLLAVLTAAPFAYYIVTQAPALLDPSEVMTSAQSSSQAAAEDSSRVSWNAILHTLRLHTGWQIHALAGPEQFENFWQTLPDFRWVGGVWMGIIAIGCSLFARQQVDLPQSQHTKRLVGRIVWLWLLAGILTFVWFPTTVELHYLIPTYPTLFILTGIGLAQLKAEWRRGAHAVLWLTSGVQVWVSVALLAFLVRETTPGGFSDPLSMHWAQASAARDLVQSGAAGEVIIAGLGDDPSIHGYPAIYDALLRDVPRRFVDIESAAVFPADGAAIVLAPSDSAAAELYRAAGHERAKTPFRAGEGNGHVILLTSADAPEPQQKLEPVELLSNWVNFLGYDRLEENLIWQFYWRVGATTDTQFQFFNHLQDANGLRMAQVDAAAFPAIQWREGDIVVSQFELEPLSDLDGPEPWTMRTGMYVYPSFENIPLLDVAANPYSDALEVELADE